MMYTGDPAFIEIDQFMFSPGQHTLFISFNLTSGAEGVHQFEFTGEVRPCRLTKKVVF